MSAARFVVSGRVQGVGFRAHARMQALALGLRGHARNRADGRVDVLATGDDAALATFADWLRQGPPLARVDAVERLPADEAAAGEGFSTG